MGSIDAGKAEVAGAYDTANTQRAANTTAQYQKARTDEAARVVEQQAADAAKNAPLIQANLNAAGEASGFSSPGSSVEPMKEATGDFNGVEADNPFLESKGFTGMDWMDTLNRKATSGSRFGR